MQRMGDEEKTLDDALQHAPELLGRLRKQYGENVTVGEIRKRPATEECQGVDLEVEIIAEGQKIGIYRHREDRLGIADQTYKGQPTGDEPVVNIERDIDDN